MLDVFNAGKGEISEWNYEAKATFGFNFMLV